MFRNTDESATVNEKLFYAIAIDPLSESDPIRMADKMRAIDDLITNHGADKDYVSHLSGLSMLGHTVNLGSMPMMIKLLSLGANPNITGVDGVPLIIHAISKNPKLVLPLLENGVDLDSECTINDCKIKVKEVIMTIAKERGFDDIISAIDDKVGVDSTSKFPIFDVLLVKKEFDKEKSESRKHFLKLLLDSGYARDISRPNPRDALLPLYDKFPNFSLALDYIYQQVGLHELSNRNAFCMSPLMLSGPPGIGKTRFVRAVSEALGISSHMVGCGGISAGWVLGGSSTSWSEGKPGMVLTSMRDGTTANPIIMLDEIDKLGGDPRYDGYGALYSLLEKHTAATFIDEAVNVPIDCTMVSWIATANELERLPKPILSRFSTIEVEAPSLEQMRDVIMSIYHDILNENKDTWGGRFSRELKDDVIDILASATPREATKRITNAFGVAAVSRMCETYELEVDDFPSTFKKQRRIGF